MLRHCNRFGLMEAYVALVSALFVVLTLLDYHHTQRTARAQAQAVLAHMEHTVTVELQQLFTATKTLLDQLDEGYRGGTAHLRRPETVNHLAMPVLRQYAPLTAVKEADSAGNSYLLLQTSSGWKNRLRSSARPDTVTWVTLDSLHRELARESKIDLVDPRQRPWYKEGIGSGTATWSRPYLLRTTGVMGITAVRSLGNREGVAGVDLELQEVSSFLQKCTSQWAGARVVVADSHGAVLATSEALSSPTVALDAPPSLSDCRFATEKEAGESMGADGHSFLTLKTKSGLVFARVAELQVAPGNAIRIIITVRSSAFTGSFAKELACNTAVYLLFLFGASLLYLKRYILPLRALARLMEECDLSSPRFFPPTKRQDEVGLLYRHLNQMTGKLMEGMHALTASEEHYRLLAENMQDVIWSTTPDYRFTYISPSDERQRGFAPHEVLRAPIWATLAPQSQDEFRALAQRQSETAEQGGRLATEVLQAEQLTRKGSIWVEIVCTPIYEGDLLTGFQGVTRDITCRRKAEEEERSARDYLNRVLNTIGDPVLVKDEEHRLILVNDAACAMFGYARDDIVGKRDGELFPAEQAEVFRRIDRLVLDTGKSNQNEEVLTGADGKPRSIVTRKTRYVDGAGNRFVVAVVRDVTELREAQGKVVASARQAGMAEIAVNVLHNVGNVLNSVAVSAGQVTKLVRASKSPGVSRVAALLKRGAEDPEDFLKENEKGKLLPEYLERLAETLGSEQSLILDELDRLQTSIGHIEDIIVTQQRYAGASGIIQPVQVRDLLEDALHINAEAIRRHGVTVVREIEEMRQMPLDKARLLLILVNLIKNAVYAMAAEASAQHRLQLRGELLADAGRPPLLRIVVADDGEGIAAENLTRIFGHGFTTKGKGHGFGLHGCALAAAEMGGSLSASSDGVGKGAAFTLEIPVGEG